MTGNFYFDDISSTDLGIYIVGINDGEDTLPLFGGQAYTSQDVINHDYETFIRTKKENIQFSLYFTLFDEEGIKDEKFTIPKLYALGKYFARSIPIEFKVEENISKVIKIIPTSSIELIRFGAMKGYFQITFQATTPYWMTPLEILSFNLSAGGSFQAINGRNIQDKYGNYDIYPKIEINNIGGQASPFILNNTTNGKQIVFNNFITNDSITIYHRQVDSQLDANIFQKWNKQPFVLTEGVNTLTVNNNCLTNVYMQYPII
jgi:hypothetical protein